MTTCGEVLVELMAGYGIDTVFGIPGVHTVELYRGLPNSGIRHITPRHEQGAGFMADGYARATGKPAGCFIITGPGLTNIATAMGQAYGDSIPMLVISSTNYTQQLGMGGGRLHELQEQRAMLNSVAAFSHTLMRPDELPDVLARAFAVFNSARPRPVLIELPLDIITAPGDHIKRKIVPVYTKPGPDPEKIEAAADLLHEARSPMVIFGGGVQDAPDAANALADALGAPVVQMTNAKGVLAPDHPLHVGSHIALPPVMDAIRSADVVLAVGTEIGETEHHLLAGEDLALTGKIIRIDIDAEQLTRNTLPEIAILSDAGPAMSALTKAVQARGPKQADSQRTSTLRAAAEDLMDDRTKQHQKVFDAILEALPEAVIVGDSTQPIYSGNYYVRMPQTRSYFNSATGYGTLGYGLPAAIGAKIGQPRKPVIAFTGDGGLQFTIGELASAREIDLPVIMVLWNNIGYQEIREYMALRDLPQIGVDIYTPDFQTIAKGFGWATEKAESLEDLQSKLKSANAANGPTMIEINEAEALNW